MARNSGYDSVDLVFSQDLLDGVQVLIVNSNDGGRTASAPNSTPGCDRGTAGTRDGVRRAVGAVRALCVRCDGDRGADVTSRSRGSKQAA